MSRHLWRRKLCLALPQAHTIGRRPSASTADGGLGGRYHLESRYHLCRKVMKRKQQHEVLTQEQNSPADPQQCCDRHPNRDVHDPIAGVSRRFGRENAGQTGFDETP
eukprot:768057-Hanusia_phi.AAC.2